MSRIHAKGINMSKQRCHQGSLGPVLGSIRRERLGCEQGPLGVDVVVTDGELGPAIPDLASRNLCMAAIVASAVRAHFGRRSRRRSRGNRRATAIGRGVPPDIAES